MDFVKFPSIENSYRQKSIDRFLAEFPELRDEAFVVTEKLRGCCITLAAFPNEPLRVGSRNRFLGPDDEFYDIWNTLPKYEHLIQEFQQYVDDVVPILGFFKGLSEALSFNTEINSSLGVPVALGANLMEGVVIQPYDKVYRNHNGKTFILKKKNEAFKEKAKAKKPHLPDAPEVERLNLEFRSYLTDARLQSVFSQYGEIEQPEQIGDYIRLLLADAREDFLKDHGEAFDALVKKEQKRVLNVGSTIARMLNKYL